MTSSVARAAGRISVPGTEAQKPGMYIDGGDGRSFNEPAGVRFAHLTDLHLGIHGRGEWHNYELFEQALQMTNAAVDSINEKKPAFVVVTGDLTHDGSVESFTLARATLDRLQMPYFVIPGNHDIMSVNSRAEFASVFKDRLASDQLYQSWEWGGIRFIGLDPYWVGKDGVFSQEPRRDVTIGMALPPFELEWLEAELKAHKNQPTILFNHHPLMPACQRFVQFHPKDAGILQNTKTVTALIRQYSQVIGFFCGHQHYNQINYLVEGDSTILHCITSAMIEYPMMWREVTVNPVTLAIATNAAPVGTLRDTSLHASPWTAGEQSDQVAYFDYGISDNITRSKFI